VQHTEHTAIILNQLPRFSGAHDRYAVNITSCQAH